MMEAQLQSRAALSLRAGDDAAWKECCAALISHIANQDPKSLIQAVAEVRQVVQAYPASRKLLCSNTALATGIANVLKPLSERSCWPETYDPSIPLLDELHVRAAEAMLWLLGWLLTMSQNAAVLHVRGDAAVLLRFVRLGASREVRRAALCALSLLHLADGSPADAASASTFLVETIGQCEASLMARLASSHAELAAAHAADPRRESAWLVTILLATICRLVDGHALPHADGPLVSVTRASWATRHAAREAFLQAGGVNACARLVGVLGVAFGSEEGHVHGHGQAEALWLLRAAFRTIGCVMVDDPPIALRAWRLLGGVDTLASLITTTGILHTGHAVPALAALLELAAGAESYAVGAAGVVMQLLPSLPDPVHALPLVQQICLLAGRNEAIAIAIAKAGVDAVALQLLTSGWPCQSDVPVSASTRQSLRCTLVRLVVRLSRAWGTPHQLRTMLNSARTHRPVKHAPR